MNIKVLNRIFNLFHMSPLIRVPDNNDARKSEFARSVVPMRSYVTEKQADEAFEQIRNIKF